jgi:hypothetical protein
MATTLTSPRTGLHTLFSVEEALVQLMGRHRRGGGALIDHLDEAIVLFIKAVDDVGGELGVAKRLANGGQRVRKLTDFVVVVRDAEVEVLTFAELTTESVGAGLGLRREGLLEDAPRLMGGFGEDDEPSDPRREGALDRGEICLILPRPNAMSWVDHRSVHAIHQRRRTRERTIDVSHQIMTPKEGEDLRTPENIIIRRELDGDVVAKVVWRRDEARCIRCGCR